MLRIVFFGLCIRRGGVLVMDCERVHVWLEGVRSGVGLYCWRMRAVCSG